MADVVAGFDGADTVANLSINANEGASAGCNDCGELHRHHEKTRESHDDGTWSWNYHCP